MVDLLRKYIPYVSVLAIAVVIGIAFFTWANGLTGDVAKLQSDVTHLAQGQAEIRQDIKDLRGEIRLTKDEVIAAIQGHEHDGEGKVFFRTPP